MRLNFIVATLSLFLTIPAIAEDFRPNGYYTFRQDLRRCASPLCGGIFVKSVNRKRTRCPDGNFQAECYVASVVNRSALNVTDTDLIKGRIKAKEYPGFGNLGVFVLKTAYRPATAKTGTGRFFGLENNGIVCITSPCFATDQYWLNRNKTKEVSNIDLSQVGAGKNDLEQALATLANGGILLVSGKNRQVFEDKGIGVTVVADQFYLPLPPDAD